jgi:hypothetical protein
VRWSRDPGEFAKYFGHDVLDRLEYIFLLDETHFDVELVELAG